MDLTITNDIQGHTLEVNIQSSATIERPSQYKQPDDLPEEEAQGMYKTNRREEAQCDKHIELQNIVTQYQKCQRPTAGLYNYRVVLFEDKASAVLLKLRQKSADQEHDELEINSVCRYKPYLQYSPGTDVKQVILMQRYYSDKRILSLQLIFQPKQLLDEILHRKWTPCKSPRRKQNDRRSIPKTFFLLPCEVRQKLGVEMQRWTNHE